MFPYFTLFIIFLAWFAFKRHRIERLEKEQEKQFWNKEAEANSVRKKDLSLLPYIVIPLDSLPFDIDSTDDALLQYESKIRDLASKKILNLTGLTNTELKLQYGAPNLTFLSECDQNFTTLVRLMQQWGKHLFDNAHTTEAENVLTQAIRWGTDIKGTYLLLAQIYHDSGNHDGILQLKEMAEQLNTSRKDSILAALAEF